MAEIGPASIEVHHDARRTRNTRVRDPASRPRRSGARAPSRRRASSSSSRAGSTYSDCRRPSRCRSTSWRRCAPAEARSSPPTRCRWCPSSDRPIRTGRAARSRQPHRLPMGQPLRLGVRRPVLGGRAVDVCPRSALKRQMRQAGGGRLRGLRRHRARVHGHALRRDGQPVKAFDNDPVPGFGRAGSRSATTRSTRSTRCRSSRSSPGARPARLGPHQHGRRGRLLAVRARLRLRRRAHGRRPPDVPARTDQGGRQAPRRLRVVHGQADRGRLAQRRAHQPQPPALDGSGTNIFLGESGWGSGLPGDRRPRRAWPGAHRGDLSHGQLLQGPRRPGRRLRGRTVTWAPTHICYGENNRSAMLRLPQARWAIENRAATWA